jgi:hypothetical protein
MKVEELKGTSGETLDVLRMTKWFVDYLDLAISLRGEGRLAEPLFTPDADRLALQHTRPLAAGQWLEN